MNDASGRLLQTKNIIAANSINNIRVDVSKYAAGLYFITLTDEKNQFQTLQINKQ